MSLKTILKRSKTFFFVSLICAVMLTVTDESKSTENADSSSYVVNDIARIEAKSRLEEIDFRSEKDQRINRNTI